MNPTEGVNTRSRFFCLEANHKRAPGTNLHYQSSYLWVDAMVDIIHACAVEPDCSLPNHSARLTQRGNNSGHGQHANQCYGRRARLIPVVGL